MKEPSVLSAIQVSADLHNSETRKREISGLLDALHEYNLAQGYILTMDSFGHEQIEGKEIIITPAWKYMLYPDLYP
ncbi:hypothetical protein [Methanocalculus sp.]|uniref:hypothetical protein n=1 Tax=Methanocalculus sp. TaxID=2004547 RepID=UPI0027205985|nr:hypothetical protein [Methanocalculus sp.]MDO8842445.1 hypothetical protein [Methanocalculus sp.]